MVSAPWGGYREKALKLRIWLAQVWGYALKVGNGKEKEERTIG